MKTMKIEKHLLITDDIKRLSRLNVAEDLLYTNETEGIRAIGPLHIEGEYETADGHTETFQERLEMDVLAPKEKLSKNPFSLHVDSFEGTPEQDGLLITIYMKIEGLQEEQSDQKMAAPEEPTPLTPQPTVEPMKVSALRDIETETVDNAEQHNEEPTSIDEFEDLFEDAGTTYTSYRMIVAKPNDTYSSIANRYDVKEAELRECNHSKPIEAKTLIILP